MNKKNYAIDNKLIVKVTRALPPEFTKIIVPKRSWPELIGISESGKVVFIKVNRKNGNKMSPRVSRVIKILTRKGLKVLILQKDGSLNSPSTIRFPPSFK